MTTTYFIDGYNVLHKLREAGPPPAEDLEQARDDLVDLVATFCSATGDVATIFFDGTGRAPESVAHRAAQPAIVYSAKKISADALIEKAVYEAKHRERIVVVTADRGIRDLCTGMGALAMTPENFFSLAEDARTRLSRTIRARRSNASPSLEDQLDDAEKEHMRRLRERLSKPPDEDSRGEA